jgi:WD40 repeat protein
MAASCGEDRVVRLWSLADGICHRTLPCRSKPLCVAFSRDGNLIVSAHYDGTLTAYDAASGSEVHRLEVHTRECVGLAPTNEPFRMASVGRDDAVCVSDIYDTKVRRPAACVFVRR